MVNEERYAYVRLRDIFVRDRIYICGGFDGHECLQTAEYYNPITNQWTLIQPMRSQRSGVGKLFLFYADFYFELALQRGNYLSRINLCNRWFRWNVTT